MDARKTVLGYLSNGCCCTEALLRFAMELMGEDDGLAADAAFGLCKGMYKGGVCGVLTGGCMALSMVSRENAADMIPEYYDWFNDEFVTKYGSLNCSEICAGNPCAKVDICMPMIGAAAEKLYEILEAHGVI